MICLNLRKWPIPIYSQWGRAKQVTFPELEGRTFCITGAGGFIGQRLGKRLLDNGSGSIVCFTRAGGRPLKDLVGSGLAGRLRLVSGNILCIADLLQAIEPGSFVIHLAGITHAGLSLQEPETCFEVNAHGTVRVLEACRLRRAAGFLFVSTGLVYGVPLVGTVNELHPTAPLSPYAASKLAAEAAVFAYASNYAIPVLIVRLSNVYGPGGHPDAVHSIIIRQILAGEPVELLDLSSVRDFIFVEDVVEALIRLLYILQPGSRDVVNVSTGRGYSIEDFAQSLIQVNCELGGKKVEVRQKGTGHLSPVRSLVLENRRLLALTGWRPQSDLRTGALMTMRASRQRKGSDRE